MPAWGQALIAGAIAALVGLTELLGRYRSSPVSSLTLTSAWLYIGLNGAAGFVALYLVRAFGWDFNQTHEVTLWRILVAGFGAVAVFRSSFFVTRIGSTTLNVGPSVVLGSLLDACDRSIDRTSAETMMEKVAKDVALQSLDPGAVISALPVLCLALMQNLSDTDAALLGTNLKEVRENTTIPATVKARTTIIHLTRFLGPDVVHVVISQNKDVLETLTAENSTQPPSTMGPDPSAIHWVLNDAREGRDAGSGTGQVS